MFSNICMESRDKNRGDPNIWTLLLWESMQGRKLTDTYHYLRCTSFLLKLMLMSRESCRCNFSMRRKVSGIGCVFLQSPVLNNVHPYWSLIFMRKLLQLILTFSRALYVNKNSSSNHVIYQRKRFLSDLRLIPQRFCNGQMLWQMWMFMKFPKLTPRCG